MLVSLENLFRLVVDAYVGKALLFRAWITRHGGVYVRPSEQTPPNPYLAVPDRDVVARDGMALTLVSPAYASRELLEEFAIKTGIRGHLTSLKLKNPKNVPDAWEISALNRLDHGEPPGDGAADPGRHQHPAADATGVYGKGLHALP